MSHVIQCPDVVRLAACLVMVSALVLSDLVLALNGASFEGRYGFKGLKLTLSYHRVCLDGFIENNVETFSFVRSIKDFNALLGSHIWRSLVL